MSLLSRWYSIKTRVSNENTRLYKWYGGSGISMFKEWEDDYKAFERYVESLPHYGEPGYRYLVRIDKRGNFEPGNLAWETKTHKNDGRKPKTGMLLTFMGESRTVPEWSEILGTSVHTIWTRKRRGWEDVECLFGRRRHGLCSY